MTTSVIVLGGYGNFGSRICAALAGEPELFLFIAGRNPDKARRLADALGASTTALQVDHTAPDFTQRLHDTGASLLVHTSGPFQGQGYAVARACIEAGCHYIDLADARGYVAGIDVLDQAAKDANVLVVSGASTVPALSAAVVDRYLPAFSSIRTIRHGISAAARPPGIATMQAVMSYVGKPFQRREAGAWRTVHGWQDLYVRDFPSPLGRRWMAACDVPDLELLPQRYPGVETVAFHAGLGYASTTLATAMLAWLVRLRLVSSLVPYAGLLHGMASLLEPFGTRWSGMHVHLEGEDKDGRPQARNWFLLAGNNQGPQIPCAPSVALVKKYLRGGLDARGAMPCMGLLGVDEILNAIPGLDLQVIEDWP